jgi:hypothetical protein
MRREIAARPVEMGRKGTGSNHFAIRIRPDRPTAAIPLAAWFIKS